MGRYTCESLIPVDDIIKLYQSLPSKKCIYTASSHCHKQVIQQALVKVHDLGSWFYIVPIAFICNHLNLPGTFLSCGPQSNQVTYTSLFTFNCGIRYGPLFLYPDVLQCKEILECSFSLNARSCLVN